MQDNLEYKTTTSELEKAIPGKLSGRGSIKVPGHIRRTEPEAPKDQASASYEAWKDAREKELQKRLEELDAQILTFKK